jgi:YHS domain-containing protein
MVLLLKETTMKRFALGVAVLCSLAVAGVFAAEVKLDGIKCVVASGKAAKAEKSADYKGGKVYFCCDGCPKAFAKDTKKFATKANAQLVATGQAKQAKCPLSGGDLNKDTEITVGGAKVQFCCNMCKGKVEKAEGDKQLEMVFGEKAFEKAGFKVEKK